MRDSPRPRRRAGSQTSRELPLTEKRELGATRTADDPIGAHLCASPSEIVRVYSTSGTTGAPTYIPLTAGDLENWVTGSARSYAASGVTAGQRLVSTYNAGPFVAGAALAAFDRIGLCHIPVGTGNTERLMAAVELLRPEAAVLTPSYAAYLLEWAAERDVDLPESSVERVLVAGEPGGGEPAFRAKLEEGWGARVTEVMGIGDIGASLWGECEEQDGMHLGARGFVHAELIEPETGVAIEVDDGAAGELVLTHLQHRAAPLLRFRTRDHVEFRTSPCNCGRAIGLAKHQLQLAPEAAGGAAFVQHQLDMPQHALERVVQLMSDAGDELSERGELFRLRQPVAQFGTLGFEACLRGHVARHNHGADAFVRVAHEGTQREQESTVELLVRGSA